MKAALSAAAAILLAIGTPLSAHRLDEYLQATLISIDKDRVQAEIRLVPGVAVLPIVLAGIDTDANGLISEAEQHAYAQRVLRDLFLTIDGDRLRPRLVSMKFPAIAEMKEGMGEIRMEIAAELPASGSKRKLIFENRHQNRIGAYLVNCLVPQDPDIRILAQNRNYTQSFYELDYVQADAPGVSRSGALGALGAIALLLFMRLAWLSSRTRPN